MYNFCYVALFFINDVLNPQQIRDNKVNQKTTTLPPSVALGGNGTTAAQQTSEPTANPEMRSTDSEAQPPTTGHSEGSLGTNDAIKTSSENKPPEAKSNSGKGMRSNQKGDLLELV